MTEFLDSLPWWQAMIVIFAGSALLWAPFALVRATDQIIKNQHKIITLLAEISSNTALPRD